MKSSQLFKVTQIEHYNEDTIRLMLRPNTPFRFEAGDYITLGFSQEDLRPFSIASSPRSDGQIELHIRKHEDSDWNQHLFSLETGEEVIIDGPNKQYRLDSGLCDTNKTIVFVAGGTGFAPMKALLDELLATGCSNRIEFFWGSRHLDDLYLRNQMIALAEHHDNLDYIEVLSQADDQRDAHFQGPKGLVHEEVLKRHPNLSDCRVYLCGPWPMVQTAKADFLSAGLVEKNFN